MNVVSCELTYEKYFRWDIVKIHLWAYRHLEQKFLLISLKQISQNTGHSKFLQVRLTVVFLVSSTNLVNDWIECFKLIKIVVQIETQTETIECNFTNVVNAWIECLLWN